MTEAATRFGRFSRYQSSPDTVRPRIEANDCIVTDTIATHVFP